MTDIITLVHRKLLVLKKTIAVAESCTGGMLSMLLTSKSGSSSYFLLGVVSYSNSAKISILGIRKKYLQNFGAVSREVAQAMVKAVQKIAHSDYAISITGIAGPGGGTIKKPVGTVWIALKDSKRLLCQKFLFKGSRSSIRKQASKKALELLYKEFLC
ncbi:MAG: CinA family protein [Candidatus Omnitrophica bacterium]|nr:CinA family protein [Candidatus Omnitrophota bacterium]